MAPPLAAVPAGGNLVFTWPTNYAGFDYTGYVLESTPSLGPSAVWTTNSVVPVIANGLLTVTNAVSGPAQFFRLSQAD